MAKKDDKRDSDKTSTKRGYNEKTPVSPEGTFPPDNKDEVPLQKPESNKSKVPGGKPGKDVR